MISSPWQNPLTLRADRSVEQGDAAALSQAIGRAADLRIRTDFRYNDHIDVESSCSELMNEISDFRVTYLVDESWAAGIMNLRYPAAASRTFGPDPSMSFFLYNQDGRQGIARPYLDGQSRQGELGPSTPQAPPGMLKYAVIDGADQGTNAPSSNFIYHFETFQFWVRDDWTEIFSHDEMGQPINGSFDQLMQAFLDGCEIKVGLKGLCLDLLPEQEDALSHEVFVHCGSGYHYTERKLFFAETQPIVRVRPNIPMQYASRGWDFGWLLVQTDGCVDGQICDPYTLAFHRREWRCPLRWFVR